MDDVLVNGKDQEEHDARLEAVLQCLKSAGVTLNREKCEFSKAKVVFLGHLIDAEGIHPDPKQTAAIAQMKPPS